MSWINDTLTKREFLENCDFNNLDIKNKIIKVYELLDSGLDTLKDKNDDDCKILLDNGYKKNNEELSIAYSNLKKDYPYLEHITREMLNINKERRKNKTPLISDKDIYDNLDLYNIILSKYRDDRLEELLK